MKKRQFSKNRHFDLLDYQLQIIKFYQFVRLTEDMQNKNLHQ